jgi:hypothetical protein
MWPGVMSPLHRLQPGAEGFAGLKSMFLLGTKSFHDCSYQVMVSEGGIPSLLRVELMLGQVSQDPGDAFIGFPEFLLNLGFHYQVCCPIKLLRLCKLFGSIY